MARGKKRFGLPALVLIASLLVSLALAETIARRFSPTFARLHGAPQPFVRPHPERNWELIPGYVGDPSWGATLRINALGLRGPEFPLAKPPGVARILMLGDSIVMGSGLSEGVLVDRKLEAELRRLRPDLRLQAINGGVAGYGVREERLFLEQQGLPLRPDAVVLVTCWNDVPGVSPGEVVNPRRDLPIPGKDWLCAHSALALMIRSLYEGLGLESGRFAALEADRHPATRARLEAGWRQYEAELAAMAADCRGHGALFLIAAAPHAAQFVDARRRFEPQQRLAAWTAGQGIPFIDLAPAFAAEPRLPYVFPDPIHLNPRGHELMAEVIAPRLAPLLPAHTEAK
jgi:lysophospholipase L1-like esterase